MRRDGGSGTDIALNKLHSALRDGTPVLIRRLVAEDAALHPDFLSDVTAEDLKLRSRRSSLALPYLMDDSI